MEKHHTTENSWKLRWPHFRKEAGTLRESGPHDTGLFATRSAAHMLPGREKAGPFNNDSYIFEATLNGGRCFAYLSPSEESLVGSLGQTLLPLFPELAGIRRQVTGTCILDGEIVVFKNSAPDRRELCNRMLAGFPAFGARSTTYWPAAFIAQDIVYGDGGQVTELPLLDRKELLRAVIRENSTLAIGPFLRGQGHELYSTVRQRGLEGVTAKHKNSRYHLGERNPNWITVKDFLEDEYIICGYAVTKEEKPAFILGQPDRFGNLLYRGMVSLGVSMKNVAAVAQRPRTRQHPFSLPPPDDITCVAWIVPSLACSISFTARDEHGMIYNPAFRGLKFDELWHV